MINKGKINTEQKKLYYIITYSLAIHLFLTVISLKAFGNMELAYELFNLPFSLLGLVISGPFFKGSRILHTYTPILMRFYCDYEQTDKKKANLGSVRVVLEEYRLKKG